MRFPAAFNSSVNLAAFRCFLIARISFSRIKPATTTPLLLLHISEPTTELPLTEVWQATTLSDSSRSLTVSGAASRGTKTNSPLQDAKTPSTGLPKTFNFRFNYAPKKIIPGRVQPERRQPRTLQLLPSV